MRFDFLRTSLTTYSVTGVQYFNVDFVVINYHAVLLCSLHQYSLHLSLSIRNKSMLLSVPVRPVPEKLFKIFLCCVPFTLIIVSVVCSSVEHDPLIPPLSPSLPPLLTLLRGELKEGMKEGTTTNGSCQSSVFILVGAWESIYEELSFSTLGCL